MLEPISTSDPPANTLIVQDTSEIMTPAPEETSSVLPANLTGKKQAVVFTGHNAYMMSVARMNRETSQFTDVVLVCPDGKVTAHRLVLAAASTTLRKAFLEVPANDCIPEHTILVPDVKKSVVAGLVDFLYTVWMH